MGEKMFRVLVTCTNGEMFAKRIEAEDFDEAFSQTAYRLANGIHFDAFGRARAVHASDVVELNFKKVQ